MKIAVTADWHGYLPPEIPDCDLLIFAGDVGLREHFSDDGIRVTHAGLAAWLPELGVPVVAVAGNHDFNPDELRALPWTYLEDESATIAGLRIWGSPWSNPFGIGWAFNLPEEEQVALYATIPSDTEIIISHGPPYGSCDRNLHGVNVGSHALAARMRELPDLQLVACGHIHESYGRSVNGEVVNGSLVDFAYRVANEPIIVEIEC